MKQKLEQRRQEHDEGVRQRLGDKVPPKRLPFRPLKGRDLNSGQEAGGLADESDLGAGR